MTTRIGLIGCGRWGRHILRDLKLSKCDVSVACTSKQSMDNAREYGADHIVDDVASLDPALDGYVVASPTASHLDIVEMLLAFGKPIFVEKPLTNDLSRAKRLHSSARYLVFIMHKWRYHPGIEEMRSIAESAELGPISGLWTRRVQWAQPHTDVDAIWILAPHDLSIVTHILGQTPTPNWATKDPTGPPGSGLLGELLDETKGIRVLVEVSASNPFWKREIVMACRDGVVSMSDADYRSLEIRHRSTPGTATSEPERRALSDRQPLLAELEAFLAHVRGGPPPMTDFEGELKILEALTTLRRMAGLDD